MLLVFKLTINGSLVISIRPGEALRKTDEDVLLGPLAGEFLRVTPLIGLRAVPRVHSIYFLFQKSCAVQTSSVVYASLS